MKVIIIHYNEIALKGKNRGDFENLLVRNIKNKLEGLVERAYKKESRILVEYLENEECIVKKLKKVFGISFFGVGEQIEREEDKIIEIIKIKRESLKGKTIKVETKRSDKRYHKTSMEVSRDIGAFIHMELGNKVDLKNPEVVVNIEILEECFLVFLRREKGLEGLPVGSSGKVLCLLSGGVDSAIASLEIMKRGCIVDFLHVTPFDIEKVKESKIPKIVNEIKEFGNKGKLFVVPYEEFYKASFELELDPKYELVLFRRFIYSLAEKICEEKGILGIVSGDSLGQVASQTLENLYAATSGVVVPIYRPLISFNKVDTINLANKLGIYEICLEKYKDCCSMVAVKHPATKAKKEKLEKYVEEIQLNKIIEKTIEKLEEI